MARMPLMAGNWKMNLNHLEAIALRPEARLRAQRQGLRRRRGRGAAAVHRHPRRCRRWSTATSCKITLRRPGPLGARLRRLHRRDLRPRCWPSWGARTWSSATPSAAQYHARGRRAGQRQGQGRAAARADPDPVRRRGLDVREAGNHVAHTLAPARRRRCDGRPGRAGRTHRRRLRAGLGHRHRRGRHPRGRPGGLRGDPQPRWPSSTPATWPTGSASCTAARSRPATSPAIMAQPDVDGALVGGASLDAEEFVEICRFRDMAARRAGAP